MARKTAEKTPVDQHRKSIGKQDYKKSKPELKEAKNKSIAKKAAAYVYKDISIMVGAMLVLIFSAYAILYILINDEKH